MPNGETPPSYDPLAAALSLDALALGPLNRELADGWLALWREGRPPARSDIDPARLVKFLPGLAIMEMHSDGSVRFRIAGRSFRAAYGFDPSHHDMIALTAPAQRAARRARCRNLAAGAVASGIRMTRDDGVVGLVSQDVMLPLSGTSPEGARAWLFHNSWRPARSDWQQTLPQAALGMVGSYVERSLR